MSMRMRKKRNFEARMEVCNDLLLAKGAARLEALSPLSVLARGYGFVQDTSGNTVTTVEGLSVDDTVKITMKDGSADARITSVRQDI